MSQAKVLVFSTLAPLPVDRGDKNRLFHIVKLLSRISRVRLVCLDREWEPAAADLSPLDGTEIRLLPVGKREVVWNGMKAAARLRPFVAFRFGLPAVIDRVMREVEDFQADVFWGYGIPSYPALRRVPGVKRVLDLVDSPSLFNSMVRKSAAMPVPARVQSFVQWRMSRYERMALESSAHVFVASRRDREHLLGLHGRRENIHVLENCVSDALLASRWQPALNGPPRLLFVGNMAYSPNVAGVKTVVRNVLPLVRSRYPQAELIVLGSGGTRLAGRLGNPAGVRMMDYVEDLVPIYLGASALISPVPVAGGTQYKMLEAMALGLPVVATSPAAEVGDMSNGRELLVADSAGDLAAAVISILENPGLAARLSGNGRDFILSRHTWENKLDKLRSVVSAP